MKLLLWAAIILAVIWILRSKKSSAKTDNAAPPRPADDAAEVMLSCAHCKTYFPASEAVFDSSHTAFCSVEHRRQHAAH
ncbi:PP0621 family protein [Herminiimonas sp. NPDC097707]|uniref:PP0621 family protein n=1 Tax=Herminiimonas sp. NPDC097707 TaxID=3364007 RepID=UPI00383BBE5D